jgi:CheY-like chemotaxis protein
MDGSCRARRPVVLIVEDEFLLRMDAVDMIAAAGFEVVEAANADQAIDIMESRRDITVVFTDIQMPGSMDGLKLARAVRGRWMAPDQDCRNFRPPPCQGNRSARRRPVPAETLQSGAACRRAARVDGRMTSLTQ